MQGLSLSLRHALRSSPWLVIALGLHGVLLAGLSIIYVAQHRVALPEAPNIPLVMRPRLEVPPPVEVTERVPLERQKIPENIEGELVDEDTFVPTDFVPTDEPQDLHKTIGEPTAIPGPPGDAPGGDNIGAGVFGNRGFGPSPWRGRTPGFPSGGEGRTPEGELIRTEAAVRDGLLWLLRHQNEDGSWSAGGLTEHCSLGRACVDESADFSTQYDPGLTALALLAFLGHGFDGSTRIVLVDEAMAVRHAVGTDVGAGLKWLMSEQGPDGSFPNYPGSMYNEALAALAFSEAYGLSRNDLLKDAAERAVKYLVAGQKSNPTSSGRWGWRYTPGGDSAADTSVTGWAVMALKSAQMSGLAVPQEAWDGALAFTEWVTGRDGLVGYLDPAGAGTKVTGVGDRFDYHTGTMSALGMLIRTFTRHDITDPFLEPAARQLVRDLPAQGDEQLGIDYYYWYYGTLALNQFDGPDSPRAGRGAYWKPWNEAMTDAVLGLQDHDTTKDICSRGGWLVGDRWCHYGGPVYATAINVLTLEVYYRYPNAFGRR
jgi:Prenyltransferase and squalene oxidase repeat